MKLYIVLFINYFKNKQNKEVINQELKEKYKKLNKKKLNDQFFDACRDGHLEVVKYLLTSPELKKHADIHAKDDLGFIWACRYGRLEVVKYLLTSAELTEHADIHAKDDWGFIWACENGHLEVVKCLIIDMNIDKTTYIEEYLNENKDNKYVQQAIELFNTRYLHHQLNENIKDNKEKVKKMKI